MRLIDADALIDKFNEKCDMATVLVDEKTAERFHTFCVLADAVEDAPTIDAEPVRHGHWEFPIFCDDYSSANDPRCKCSECGSIEMPLARHNYCPHCGAKMDEVSE